MQKKLASGLLALFAWSLLGALIGTGIGYFAYAKTPAVFESSAALQISGPSLSDAGSHRGGVVDDSRLLVSESVLNEAVAVAQLDRLPEMSVGSDQSASPAKTARALATGGNLSASFESKSSQGAVYDIRYLGATPSSAQQVVAAVVAACQQAMPRAADPQDWRESLELLTVTRREVDERVAELNSQLNGLDAPDDAVIRDETLISKAAQSNRRLQSQTDQLEEELRGVTAKLRQAESMIAEGSPIDSILLALGQPIQRDESVDARAKRELAMQQEIAEAERLRVERERILQQVERELEPLQEELNKLLETLGDEHPTVRSVRAKIRKAREPLADLPDEERPSVDSSISLDSLESPDTKNEKGAQVSRLLRSLRNERQQIQQQVAESVAELEQSTEDLARQQKLLQREQQIRAAISHQHAIAAEVGRRLTHLSSAPPTAVTELTVLREAAPGIQIAPLLMPLITTGAKWGAIAGAILALLLWLTSVATSDEGVSHEEA